jgi:predicted Rossmann fold flavoprotein
LGAGAAGLFCAAVAGQRGRRVLLLEHNAAPGRKILISGGGRCNFTNRQVTAANFLSANPHFAKSALARYTPGDFLALLKKHRVSWHEKTLGQLFCDESARQVVDLLLAECAEGHVDLRLSCRVESVARTNGFEVQTNLGAFRAPALVVATGGLSIPKLGATDFGYRLATQFGLPLEKPAPALVPLTLSATDREAWCDLSGVSLAVTASLGRTRFQEKMLITHRGISGPAVLQISSYWRPSQSLQLDLLPGTDLTGEDPGALRVRLMAAWPQRFAQRWLEREGFTQPLLSPRRVDERVHAWPVIPAGTEGFEKAEVTSGGVSTSALSSSTMETRNVPGLFFVGEIVDVTGWLGGYNFQWAWSSAFAAAQAL